MGLEFTYSHLSSNSLIEIKRWISVIVYLLALISIEGMPFTYMLACQVPNMIETVQIMNVVKTVEHIVWDVMSLIHFSICSIATSTELGWIDSFLIALNWRLKRLVCAEMLWLVEEAGAESLWMNFVWLMLVTSIYFFWFLLEFDLFSLHVFYWSVSIHFNDIAWTSNERALALLLITFSLLLGLHNSLHFSIHVSSVLLRSEGFVLQSRLLFFHQIYCSSYYNLVGWFLLPKRWMSRDLLISV